MSISLSKGQTLSLAKNNPGLSRVFMGLGWDPIKKGGFLGGFSAGRRRIDRSGRQRDRV